MHFLLKKILHYTVLAILSLLLLPFLILFLLIRFLIKTKLTRECQQRFRNGFNLLETADIGGIKQWLSIRGEKKSNPFLLILHGGPGASMMPYAKIFDPLVAHYNIVQWDQRGTGKTFRSNKKVGLEQTSFSEMFSDTVQVVNYLRTRFQQDKIYIFGHSWGSVLGLSLAYHHPDLLHAYIGAGQIINTRLNEQKGFADTLQLATQKQHRKAMDALLQITSFQQDHVAISLDEFMILRKWQFHLNGLGLKKSELIRILVAALCVPEYSLLDYISLISSMLKVSKSKQMLNDVMQVNFNNQTNFSTPIILFGCGKDYLTHSSFVHEYFQKINAPYKRFIDLPNAGHNLFFDDPKQFICGVESALVAAKLDHMNFS